MDWIDWEILSFLFIALVSAILLLAVVGYVLWKFAVRPAVNAWRMWRYRRRRKILCVCHNRAEKTWGVCRLEDFLSSLRSHYKLGWRRVEELIPRQFHILHTAVFSSSSPPGGDERYSGNMNDLGELSYGCELMFVEFHVPSVRKPPIIGGVVIDNFGARRIGNPLPSVAFYEFVHGRFRPPAN